MKSIYAIYNAKGDRMYQYGQSGFVVMSARLALAKEKYPDAGMKLKRICINSQKPLCNMRATVIFSNVTGECRLVVPGAKAKIFASVSSMLDFCRQHGIEVTVGNCVTE